MAGETILVVEDDGILAADMQDMLTGLGYEVLEPAASGEEAVCVALEQQPDLILMDIKLAGEMTGIAAATQIGASSDIPVVFLTGYSQDSLLQQAKATAPYGYLVKPVSERDLTATMEMAIYKHALDRKLRESEAALQRMNDSLETLVRERTTELEAANESLRTEIAERKLAEEDRNRIEEQLRHVQKMEALGRLAGGIAHDFNNILATILGQSELALCSLPRGIPARQNLAMIQKACNRARDLAEGILSFSRRREGSFESVPLGTVLKDAVRLLRASLPSTVKIHTAIDPAAREAKIAGNPSQIHQVIMNLGLNARHAMGEKGGKLDICLDCIEAGPELRAVHPEIRTSEHYLRLSVSDTGHGIDSSIIDRIFDPFFTTKAPSEGTGMGLAIAYGIIKSHGGVISVDSEAGKGTVFSVFLPKSEIESSGAGKSNGRLSKGKGCILLVDDETDVMQTAEGLLKQLGYEVIACSDSERALEIFKRSSERFHLVITDQTMPRLVGTDLAREIKRIRPHLPIILCTGFGYGLDARELERTDFAGLLTKPFTMRKLSVTVHDALKLVNG